MESNGEDLGLLIIRLSDKDVEEQDAAAQIRNKLSYVVESANISQLLINLENVGFLKSEAIGQLFMLKKKCDQNQISLGVCSISPQNMKVLKLVRCDTIIDLFEDQQTAIDALAKTLPPAPSPAMEADAVQQLTDKASAGNADAIFELAQRKADGKGIPQDVDGAILWYQKAAEQDHREAQYELATCYAFGLGVPQDYGKAIPWYEKAAVSGHANSQYMFAMSYQYALNDVSDVAKAKIWYERAAEQGHEKAKLALRELES